MAFDPHNPMVSVSISVEHMRHQILHHLSAHQAGVHKAVADQMETLIESGALDEQVKQSVAHHLREAIDQAVKSAVTAWARESPSVKRAIQSAVETALWEKESQ